MAENAWLIAGLGNPGPGYAHNRHNVGFMVADALASEIAASFGTRAKHAALVAEGFDRPGGVKLIIAKPQTFMNDSGRSLSALAKFYSVPIERIVIVHDELDVPFDTVRLKLGGGHGGHNGLRSIAASLGSSEFVRVRVGIGRPPGRMDAADFVLKDFAGTERDALPNLIADATDAVLAIVRDGLLAAQQRFHAPA